MLTNFWCCIVVPCCLKKTSLHSWDITGCRFQERSSKILLMSVKQGDYKESTDEILKCWKANTDTFQQISFSVLIVPGDRTQLSARLVLEKKKKKKLTPSHRKKKLHNPPGSTVCDYTQTIRLPKASWYYTPPAINTALTSQPPFFQVIPVRQRESLTVRRHVGGRSGGGGGAQVKAETEEMLSVDERQFGWHGLRRAWTRKEFGSSERRKMLRTCLDVSFIKEPS